MSQIVFERPADKIRAKFSDDRAKILARNELTPTAKAARVALALKTANAQLAAAKSAADEARQAARAKNERTAFGLDDLASSPGDRAAITMAHRAALDKVATIGDSKDAAALLARARTSGDETMVRALALHAHLQVVASGFTSEGWQNVLGDAARSRPAAIDAINSLLAEAKHLPQGAEMFEFMIVTPTELGNATTDAQLDRIIAQDPSMGLVR